MRHDHAGVLQTLDPTLAERFRHADPQRNAVLQGLTIAHARKHPRKA